jgi:hypothetical protein
LVGYDSADISKPVLAFLNDFVGFLAKSWNVEPELRGVGASDAPELLQDGGLDLMASPDPLLPGPRIPFFATGGGVPWQLSSSNPTFSDSTFNDAVAGFLVATLKQRKLRVFWYQSAFLGPPLYEPLQGLLVEGPPTIAAVSPTEGTAGSTTINGSHLTGASSVTFNGVPSPAGSFTIVSDGQITVRVPSSATTGPVSVTTPAETQTTAAAFTVT